MLKICVQVVLVYLQPFRRNSVMKCAMYPKIAKKKSLKTPFWGSRSFKVIKNLSPVLVIISSMFVPICNRFHTIRANNGKITPFYVGVPLFDALVRKKPVPRDMKFCREKLETLRPVSYTHLTLPTNREV